MNIDKFDLDAHELVAIEKKLSDLLSAKHNKSLQVHLRDFSFELSEVRDHPEPTFKAAIDKAAAPPMMIACVWFHNPVTGKYECRKR